MTQASRSDIEHPAQLWWQDGYSEQIDAEHEQSLAERFADSAVSTQFVIDALSNATAYNHAYRIEHEHVNLHRLGLVLPKYRNVSGDAQFLESQIQYEHLAGVKQHIGAYALWFSHETHRAFVDQEPLSLDYPLRFKEISLELGGKRQFGNWEATGGLDTMIRSVPRLLIENDEHAQIVVYGNGKGEQFLHHNVKYVVDAPKSYRIFPRYVDGALSDRLAMVRRRRPIADIFVEGQSDTVLYKESIGLILLDQVAPQLRYNFLNDVERSVKAAQQAVRENPKQKYKLKIQDTLAAKIGGKLFEQAITAPEGVSKDVIPVSAHYVQGVGEKYAQFRSQVKE